MSATEYGQGVPLQDNLKFQVIFIKVDGEEEI